MLFRSAVDRREIQSLFRSERERFAVRYPACAGATLTVVEALCPQSRPRCAPRDVAWCYPATGQVFLLARALSRSRASLVGLLRHELAHLACPTCSERQTDLVAGRVGGARIRYGRDLVQTLSPRARHASRPRHLPR